MATRAASLALLTILAACDGGGACDPMECDEDGRCWASIGWPMRPEAIEAATLEAALDVALEPADGDCYAVINTDAHVCTVDVGCALLFGRPVAEVALGPECAPAGPWSWSGDDAEGQCWVVIGGVAVVVIP